MVSRGHDQRSLKLMLVKVPFWRFWRLWLVKKGTTYAYFRCRKWGLAAWHHERIHQRPWEGVHSHVSPIFLRPIETFVVLQNNTNNLRLCQFVVDHFTKAWDFASSLQCCLFWAVTGWGSRPFRRFAHRPWVWRCRARASKSLRPATWVSIGDTAAGWFILENHKKSIEIDDL